MEFNNLKNFDEVRQEEQEYDVTIMVCDQPIRANRKMLEEIIPYFGDLLKSCGNDKVTIAIDELDPRTVETLINFAFSGWLRVDSENAKHVMTGASILGMTEVFDFCAEYLSACTRPENVLRIRQFAQSPIINCTKLARAADKFIDEHYTMIAQTNDFLRLDFAQCEELLRRDELNVESEEIVFDSCIRWVEFDPADRSQHLQQLLTHVRLPLLPVEFLVCRVGRCELIRASLPCRDLVDLAKDYQLMPERRGELKTFRLKHRCNMKMKMIYVIGVLSKYPEHRYAFEIYDLRSQTWTLKEQSSTIRKHVGAVAMKGTFYIFGGSHPLDRLNTFQMYSPQANLWTPLAPPTLNRTAVAITAIDTQIYICGGFDGITPLSCVERYCTVKNEWITVAPLPTCLSSLAVATLDDQLYAAGGHDCLFAYASVVRYDPRENVWCMVAPMLYRRSRLGLAALNGRLYACGGFDGIATLNTLEMYNPETDCWKLLKPMITKRSRFALVANMGQLWAIGGFDGLKNLNTVERYDLEKNQWTLLPSMKAFKGAGISAVVLDVADLPTEN